MELVSKSTMIGSRVIAVGLRRSITDVVRQIHTTTCKQSNVREREKKGLPRNPNAFGYLTNLPDYTYTDGRSTPYGAKQFRRLQKHQKYTERIVKLVGEIDNAVERYDRLKRQEEEERQKILDSKLKPKGNLILESTTEGVGK